MTFVAIFAQKFDYSCLYLPEALINLLKHCTKVKVLLNETTWTEYAICYGHLYYP